MEAVGDSGDGSGQIACDAGKVKLVKLQRLRSNDAEEVLILHCSLCLNTLQPKGWLSVLCLLQSLEKSSSIH